MGSKKAPPNDSRSSLPKEVASDSHPTECAHYLSYGDFAENTCNLANVAKLGHRDAARNNLFRRASPGIENCPAAFFPSGRDIIRPKSGRL